MEANNERAKQSPQKGAVIDFFSLKSHFSENEEVEFLRR
jgi:hypothetical protein